MKSKKENNVMSININDPLFKIIDPNQNDSFSDMNGSYLQELIYYLDHYYLEFRNQLAFPDSVTFGMELECDNSRVEDLLDILEKQLEECKLRDWHVTDDGSLFDGAEVISPILKDKSESWAELKLVCEIVSDYASIGENCGGHIHVGTQVLGAHSKAWYHFIKLWAVYENVIYRFVYGNYLCPRPNLLRYACPIAPTLLEFLEKHTTSQKNSPVDLDDIIGEICYDRNQAVNFDNITSYQNIEDNNTIEFRCPNGTLDPVVWQNNINLFVSLLLYCKSSRYNDEIIDQRRKKNNEKYSTFELYGEIYLQQALELCDMIFEHNLDKLYFLRQYLKSFEIGNEAMLPAKQFTKKMKKNNRK